jgi:general secretion pathway protein E
MKRSETPVNPGTSLKEDVNALKGLAEKYGLTFIDSVSDDMLAPDLVSDLPVEWARSNILLPIRMNGELCVLTCKPEDVGGQEYLSLLLGEDLSPVVAEGDVIADTIERCYYSKDDSPEEFLQDLDPKENEEVVVSKSDDLLQVAQKAPVTQLVNLILLEAVKRKASDIHFEPYESSLRVRYRVDGILYEQSCPPKHLEEALVSRLKVMARLDIAERRLPQDGMAKVRVGDREIDIRMSTVPVAEGERVVLRILDKDSALLPLSVLGMNDNVHNEFQELLAESNGVILVSGPTGSGKTTTLYAALQNLDASRKNIMTIENPIEYQLPDIGQIQVKPKIGLTFASGLRHILRQDPDVILVGETRDQETADIAIRASLTGHLVFTTLHTNDAPGAVLRLADMGVEPYLLASCLKGVLAQKLVRRVCPQCRRTQEVSARQSKALGATAEMLKGQSVWSAEGCPACLEGYSGRFGLFELMIVDSEIRDLIRSGDVDSSKLRAVAEKNGMASIIADGVSKAIAGDTTLDEVIDVTCASV